MKLLPGWVRRIIYKPFHTERTVAAAELAVSRTNLDRAKDLQEESQQERRRLERQQARSERQLANNQFVSVVSRIVRGQQ